MALAPPKILRELVKSGRWRHPGHERLSAAVPFISDPLVFIMDGNRLGFRSMPLIGAAEVESRFFHEYRGSKIGESRSLPWRDVEKSLFIAVNPELSDEVGLALDFRTSLKDPRVIGSDWTEEDTCHWKEVAPTFTCFCQNLGIKV